MSPEPPLRKSLPPVYAAALLRLIFPLVVLPVMAARLGAEEFGRLSLFLVWAGLLAMVVEGGFLAAATRLAVVAEAPARWRLAQQVFSARVALSGVAALLSCGVGLWVLPQVGSVLLLAALACAMGWPATWYLQASAQLHRWARVELAVYALWLVAALTLAHSVTVYLLLNLAAVALLSALGWSWLRRDLALQRRLWARSALQPGLRLGWTMMPVSLAGAAYSFALPAVASTQMGRSELGVYYLADRTVRALLAAADPVFQLIYPRIVQRFERGSRAAWAYAAVWALGGLLSGVLLLVAGALLWPWARGWLAVAQQGVPPQQLQAVMAVLAWLLPLLLSWKFFGYAMLGSGRFDRAYRACVVVGGVFGVVAALLFAHEGAVMLAWVALAVELVVIATALAGMALTKRG
jgi:O-antigen/teichoic acid export membrane protein